MAIVTTSLVRVTTVCAVVVVALIAAVVSYSHMQQLAYHAGEDWRSWLIPLSIDGLVVAASMALLTRRRNGLPGGPLAWGALGAGVVASLAANMADARPELTAVLVAGWPAAAFAVAFELLLQQRRAESSAATEPTAPAAPPIVPEPTPPPIAAFTRSGVQYPAAPVVARVVPEQPAPTPVVAPQPPAGAAPVTPVEFAPVSVSNAAPSSSPSPDPALHVRAWQASGADDDPAVGDHDLVGRVRRLLADTDPSSRPPGRREIAKRLNVSEHRARLALESVGAATGPALNGTSGCATPQGAGQGHR